MNRDDVSWQGYLPATVTPFTEDGDLDLGTLAELVDFYAAEGMHGVMVNGTCGEWFSQSPAERLEVARTTVQTAAGRMTVLVGTTGYTAAESAALARDAFAVGADGVVISPPPYVKLFPDEVEQYYRDITALVEGPIAVYNWPHGAGIDIDTELADRLADIDGIVAIKDSTPNGDQFFATSRTVRDRVRVFGNYMSRRGVEELLEHGGDGFIGGGALRGHAEPAFWDSYWAGEREPLFAYAEVADRMFERLWLPGGWAGKYGSYQAQLKELMRMLGQPAGHVRRPRLPITRPDYLAALREVLVDEGLLEGPVPA